MRCVGCAMCGMRCEVCSVVCDVYVWCVICSVRCAVCVVLGVGCVEFSVIYCMSLFILCDWIGI